MGFFDGNFDVVFDPEKDKRAEIKAEAEEVNDGDDYRKSIWYALQKMRESGKMTDQFLIGRTTDATETPKGIRQGDRTEHFYAIGGTGRGKTKFLETLVAQDIFHGAAFGIIDPHGDLIRNIKAAIVMFGKGEHSLEDDVVLIDPTDKEYTACLNPLEPIAGVDSTDIAQEVVKAFERIWGATAWGARLQQVFRERAHRACRKQPHASGSHAYSEKQRRAAETACKREGRDLPRVLRGL